MTDPNVKYITPWGELSRNSLMCWKIKFDSLESEKEK